MTAEAASQEELLTVDYVAMRCNVSDKTIRRWVKDGHMACVLVGPTKRIRIARSELVRLLNPSKGSNHDQAPTS